MREKLLILDLDETLVFGTTEGLPRPADMVVGKYHIYRRPGVDGFLNFSFEHFRVAVWTSSTLPYATEIVKQILPENATLEFLWGRERCTRRVDLESRESYWIKDLKKVKKLGYNLESVIMVDDSPEKLERNYGNHVIIRPFQGETDDNELMYLSRYLLRLKELPSVRAVEKRSWRKRMIDDLSSPSS
jgi:RNA polymerase II subunit A small phosphatase-like protein